MELNGLKKIDLLNKDLEKEISNLNQNISTYEIRRKESEKKLEKYKKYKEIISDSTLKELESQIITLELNIKDSNKKKLEKKLYKLKEFCEKKNRTQSQYNSRITTKIDFEKIVLDLRSKKESIESIQNEIYNKRNEVGKINKKQIEEQIIQLEKKLDSKNKNLETTSNSLSEIDSKIKIAEIENKIFVNLLDKKNIYEDRIETLEKEINENNNLLKSYRKQTNDNKMFIEQNKNIFDIENIEEIKKKFEKYLAFNNKIKTTASEIDKFSKKQESIKKKIQNSDLGKEIVGQIQNIESMKNTISNKIGKLEKKMENIQSKEWKEKKRCPLCKQNLPENSNERIEKISTKIMKKKEEKEFLIQITDDCVEFQKIQKELETSIKEKEYFENKISKILKKYNFTLDSENLINEILNRKNKNTTLQSKISELEVSKDKNNGKIKENKNILKLFDLIEEKEQLTIIKNLNDKKKILEEFIKVEEEIEELKKKMSQYSFNENEKEKLNSFENLLKDWPSSEIDKDFDEEIEETEKVLKIFDEKSKIEEELNKKRELKKLFDKKEKLEKSIKENLVKINDSQKIISEKEKSIRKVNLSSKCIEKGIYEEDLEKYSKLSNKEIEENSIFLKKSLIYFEMELKKIKEYQKLLDQGIEFYQKYKVDFINKTLENYCKEFTISPFVEKVFIEKVKKKKEQFKFEVFIKKIDKTVIKLKNGSSGEKKMGTLLIRLAIAQTFNSDSVMTLDEPTGEVDEKTRNNFSKLLKT